MKKVIFFMGKLQKYRVPIFEELSKKYDINVVCDNKNEYKNDTLSFNLIQNEIKKFGPFLFHEKNIWKTTSESDVVVGLMNIRFLDLFLYSITPFRQCGLVLWGIGVNGSYEKKFGSIDFALYLRILMGMFADSLVFYSSFPIRFYKNGGVKVSKMFVANNTVSVLDNYNEDGSNKNDFIFIGTIYLGKGLDLLIEAYCSAYLKIGDKLCNLTLIGGGEGVELLQNEVNKLNLSHKIKFCGPIYDENLIYEKFKSAIISISPNQAGLSVLKSMGYGVPFVTKHDAITGGERLNIQNGINGCLFSNKNDLEEILIDASVNKKKYLDMGCNAHIYYKKNRTIYQMAKGLSDAIEYAGWRRL
jgi:glycosyltransferase involved in cell wall biosynthesis